MGNFTEIQLQLNRLRKLLSRPDTDLSWTYIESVDDILKELTSLENGMMNGDGNSFKEILFLLAPTNYLQEISISSGWSEEFLDVAERLEKQIYQFRKNKI